MVLHGEELHVKIKHIGMHQGNMVVKVETNNDRDVEVLEGTAEAAQPPTSSVFAGQGPQESGMGMELYNNSPAARAVWDAADAHLLAVYDFSIKIVKDNPGGGGHSLRWYQWSGNPLKVHGDYIRHRACVPTSGRSLPQNVYHSRLRYPVLPPARKKLLSDLPSGWPRP